MTYVYYYQQLDKSIMQPQPQPWIFPPEVSSDTERQVLVFGPADSFQRSHKLDVDTTTGAPVESPNAVYAVEPDTTRRVRTAYEYVKDPLRFKALSLLPQNVTEQNNKKHRERMRTLGCSPESYLQKMDRTTNLKEVKWTLSDHGYGRLKPSDQIAFASMQRHCRNTVIHDCYYDFDIVAAVFAVTLNKAEAAGSKCGDLKAFVENRDAIFQRDQKEYGKPRDGIKEVWTSLINGGRIPDWYRNPLARSVEQEMCAIRSSIARANPKLLAVALAKKQEEGKYAASERSLEEAALRSTFSYWYFTHERQIVDAVLDWCDEQGLLAKSGDEYDGKQVYNRIHDGFNLMREAVHGWCERTGQSVDALIENLEQVTYDRTGFQLQWKLKDFDDCYDIGHPMVEVLSRNNGTLSSNESGGAEQPDLLGETDEDFAALAFQHIRGNFVYSQGQLFHKEGHIWSNDPKAFESNLRASIIALKMKKRTVREIKGGTTTTDFAYCDMVKNLKNVCILTQDKILLHPVPSFYKQIHATTRGKLCFNDGVYDFAKRAFHAWSSRELQDTPVYSLVKIHRNFPTADSVSQAFKDECTNKIFTASMGEENAKLWMQFLARAVAGCIQDKLWAVLMTNRDCSKGVLNDWLMSAFGAYAKQTESENFLVQRDRGADAAKKNAWLVDFQPVRLMLVQEFPLDTGNKRLKIDSKLIKSINSGGDEIEGRKNYKDAMTFNVQCSSIFMLNDAPPLTTDDVLEKCLQTTSTVQFKSREYIDAELLAADGRAELLEFRKKNYKLADPGLRCAVKSDAYANALVRILIDHYSDTAVQLPKLHVEGEQDQRLDERVLAAFKLTGDVDNDFVSNEHLRGVAGECGCSVKKLKVQLLGMNAGIREGRGRMDGESKYGKGLRGLLARQLEPLEEESA